MFFFLLENRRVENKSHLMHDGLKNGSMSLFLNHVGIRGWEPFSKLTDQFNRFTGLSSSYSKSSPNKLIFESCDSPHSMWPSKAFVYNFGKKSATHPRVSNGLLTGLFKLLMIWLSTPKRLDFYLKAFRRWHSLAHDLCRTVKKCTNHPWFRFFAP